MDKIREAYESKLYEMNNRMMATEDRWKDLNHLLISSLSNMRNDFPRPSKVHLSRFMLQNGVSENSLVVDKDLIFVLTPFNREFAGAFQLIRRTCSDLGYKCLRGDEQIATGDILARILKLICSARLVIANIDGRNPNVFFELGIALSMDKDVVIVANNNTNNPFDIMRENIVLWQNHSELRTKLKDMVLKALANQGMANKSLELSP